jgi:hypothetical protein
MPFLKPVIKTIVAMLKPIHCYLRKALPVQRFRLRNPINSFPVTFSESQPNILRTTVSIVPGNLFLSSVKEKMSGLTASRLGNLFSPT